MARLLKCVFCNSLREIAVLVKCKGFFFSKKRRLFTGIGRRLETGSNPSLLFSFADFRKPARFHPHISSKKDFFSLVSSYVAGQLLFVVLFCVPEERIYRYRVGKQPNVDHVKNLLSGIHRKRDDEKFKRKERSFYGVSGFR